MFAVESGAACPTAQGVKCSGHPRPPSSRQGGKLCPALMAAQQIPHCRKERERRWQGEKCRTLATRAGGGAWEALMPGLWAWPGDRLAPTHAFTAIKALRKNPKRSKELFLQQESSHLPLGRGDIRKLRCHWSGQGWLLSHTISMRQWDEAAVIISGSPAHAAGPCVVASCHGTGANRRPRPH